MLKQTSPAQVPGSHRRRAGCQGRAADGDNYRHLHRLRPGHAAWGNPASLLSLGFRAVWHAFHPDYYPPGSPHCLALAAAAPRAGFRAGCLLLHAHHPLLRSLPHPGKIQCRKGRRRPFGNLFFTDAGQHSRPFLMVSMPQGLYKCN